MLLHIHYAGLVVLNSGVLHQKIFAVVMRGQRGKGLSGAYPLLTVEHAGMLFSEIEDTKKRLVLHFKNI